MLLLSLVSDFSFLNRFGLHTNQLEQKSNCLKPIYLVLCLETVICTYVFGKWEPEFNKNQQKQKQTNLFLSFKSI